MENQIQTLAAIHLVDARHEGVSVVIVDVDALDVGLRQERRVISDDIATCSV